MTKTGTRGAQSVLGEDNVHRDLQLKVGNSRPTWQQQLPLAYSWLHDYEAQETSATTISTRSCKMVTCVYEDSLLLCISCSPHGRADLPSVSCCREYNSSTGIAFTHSTLFSRKGASLGGSIASGVTAALLRLVPLTYVPDVACTWCLERVRPRTGSCSDTSVGFALAAYLGCVFWPFRRSRCRHSALWPSQLLTFLASLSAIATLLCLPILQ